MLLLLLACSGSEPPAPTADADFQKQLQEQLILAQPGAVIEVPAGTWHLDQGLSLTVEGVTIRGAGPDKTILNFKGQSAGAEGLLVTADDFTIEDIALEDTRGDALKVKGADGVTIRRVRTEWTRGPHEENGAYGIYPVQCKRVLIEHSVAIGASDAGVYVGQSEQIIVRHNRAENNVAGIEIENSRFADVHDNVATHNTGGILVFDLPDLPVQGGRNTRVFDNEVVSNNTDNFAPEGNIVGIVPPGTGILVFANDQVEVFNNTIRDHDTLSVAVASYLASGKPINDPSYDPYPEAIYVHDNTITASGDDPRGMLVKAMALAIGSPFPAIVYDGIVDDKKLGPDGKLPPELRICARNNGGATIANIDAAHDFDNVDRDPASFDCDHPPLQEIRLDAVADATAQPAEETAGETDDDGNTEGEVAEGAP
ncbi:MAG: right-handed parallel beta-helix repeat-containing protein [Alphaproteobacteria bacterium]|nr:right-handed parallel beta-helix repeat-containing protein [Alphaproteobacteria bacterium]